MFENFNEIMDETLDELQENEVMEQGGEMPGGEVPVEEAEMVGRGEYSPEAVSNAWHEYNGLSDKQKETFLRGHSRNAHIMNRELRNERAGSTTGETAEAKESVGYSSDYYKHELATAKNDIQRDYAMKNYRAALAKEAVGTTTGEGEAAGDPEAVGYYAPERAGGLREEYWESRRGTPERVYRPEEKRYAMGSTTGEGEAAETGEEPEAVGYYSSDYYERRMATALETGNRTMYNNARKDWAEAKVRESVGSTTGEGEAAETGEDREAVGYYSSDYYERRMATALETGNRTMYNNARKDWAEAKVRESVGYIAEDGSIIEGLDPNERHGREK